MPAKPNPGDLTMTTKPTTVRKLRRVYIKWDRCVEDGRKLGVMFVALPLYVVLRFRRECPDIADWPGILINWDKHCLLDTTAWGIRIARWWNR
jgi:hypothetical protein